jgi:hypothetical protein
VAIICDDAINRAVNWHRAGNPADQPEWPEPPDVSHQNDGGIRAAQHRLIRAQQSHFLQKFWGGQIELGAHPIGLQGNKTKAVAEQGTFDAAQPATTE